MKKILMLVISALIFVSCSTDFEYENMGRVVLVYMADDNNLSYFASSNYDDIYHAELPPYFEKGTEHGDILLVYTRNRKRSVNETSLNQPELLRMSKGANGKTIVEVIKKYPVTTNSATAETLENVLEYTGSLFSTEKKGLVLWSHGTGWIENGQYRQKEGMQRSFGYENGMEIDIPELADAIPSQYDFILFDACLMGGVEVAYELKDKAKYIIASPTEVMGAGFPYKKLIPALFDGNDFDLPRVCRDYYDFYSGQSYPSATVSLINTSSLEHLARAARRIIVRDADNIGNLNISEIQKYFSGDFHWFYDLRDFYTAISTDEVELMDFETALYNAIPYKLNTEYYFDSSVGSTSAKIERYSGLSTYIPFFYGETRKDEYYKNLAWAKAVGFANM